MRLILIVVLAVVSCCAQTITLPTDARKWETWGWYMDGPNVYNNGGVVFDWPQMPENVTYVGVRSRFNIDSKHYVTFTGQLLTSGNPVFDYNTEPGYNTCVFPAHARAYLEQKGWANGDEFYRWWSQDVIVNGVVTQPASVLLAAPSKSFSVTIPLTPDRWSSVFGKYGNSSPQALAGWHRALKNLVWIGFSLGGGCFFGHGVGIDNGSAQFIVTSYTIY